MAINHRLGTKVSKNLRREEASATRIEPYPYIGIVKNNLDPSRSGRLQVWIPDLGGDPQDAQNWRTVSYASPFMGTTTHPIKNNTIPSKSNKFDTVSHTYGMWMIPPDLDVEVIVIFVAGDPTRGYWIGCVNSNVSKHMTPGVAGSTKYDISNSSPETQKAITALERANIQPQPPVVEFNEYNENAFKSQAFYNNKKPVHEYQFKKLREQGLDCDPYRGATTSSSQRETPSNVFGISTPGRPYNDPADDTELVQKILDGKLNEDFYRFNTKKGGHVFVMDDGSITGADQMIRLRTANGHQITMHDSADMLYIAHGSGNSWLEMTSSGSVNVYSKGSLNIRSETNINLQADNNVNIEAKNKINIRSTNKTQMDLGSFTMITAGAINLASNGITNIKSQQGFNVDATGAISVLAGGKLALTGSQILENSGGEKKLKMPKQLVTNKFPDVGLNKDVGLYVSTPNSFDSVVTAAPTHEPYGRFQPTWSPIDAGRFDVSAYATKENLDKTVQKLPSGEYTGSVDAVKDAKGTEVKNAAGDKQLRVQPTSNQTLGPLEPDDMTAYYTQLGQSESSGDYTSTNELGYVGKYQMGHSALIDAGLVKSSVTSNADLNNPNNWLGKDGQPASLNEFLNTPQAQEDAVKLYTQKNYNTLLNNGGITKEMSKEEIGGMLSTAHLLGATGAKDWRNTGAGADANGTTGTDYFQRGKYAVSVLGPKVPQINAG